MAGACSEKIYCRVTVIDLVSSRYPSAKRPESWDDRVDGTDVIKIDEGEGRTLRLFSDGGQSPPQPGWVIQLISKDEGKGHRWTLYGMPGTQ